MSHRFRFENFQPTLDLELTATAMLNQLIELSPNPSASLARLALTEQGYRCHVQIETAAGAFQAETICIEPTHAIDQTDEKLRRKILQWQSENITEENSAEF